MFTKKHSSHPGLKIIIVGCGKVGSNLTYNKDTNKVTSTPYHVLNNQWHNYAEGITFDY